MKYVCGLDEAGRGPLAGPVTAGCVVLSEDFDFSALNDSKKISEKKRLKAEAVIKEKAVAWSVAVVSHETIDKINILNASLLAMRLALEGLHTPDGKPYQVNHENTSEIIVDGNRVPKLEVDSEITVRALVKADSIVHEVMAASILAKTERDRIMCEYDKLYPEYQYAKHKGYPTELHRKLCKELGPSPIQRKSFAVR